MLTTPNAFRLALVIVTLGTDAPTACAQKPPASRSNEAPAVGGDSLAGAQQFAQQFLERYVSEALADEKLPAYWRVLDANSYLDAELALALRADSVARANFRAETRDLMDMDPFLGGQDYCKLPPRVTAVRRRGSAFVVSALTCVQSAAQTGGPTVDLVLVPVIGTWRIANVTFGQRMELKSYLCRLAQTDIDPAKRPGRCPPESSR